MVAHCTPRHKATTSATCMSEAWQMMTSLALLAQVDSLLQCGQNAGKGQQLDHSLSESRAGCAATFHREVTHANANQTQIKCNQEEGSALAAEAGASSKPIIGSSPSPTLCLRLRRPASMTLILGTKETSCKQVESKCGQGSSTCLGHGGSPQTGPSPALNKTSRSLDQCESSLKLDLNFGCKLFHRFCQNVIVGPDGLQSPALCFQLRCGLLTLTSPLILSRAMHDQSSHQRTTFSCLDKSA